MSPRRELRASLSDRYALSGWEALRRRHSSATASSSPNIFNFVTRATMLKSVLDAEVMKRFVDQYLQPPVAHLDMFDWVTIDTTFEIGYRCAIEQLQAGLFTGDERAQA